MGFKLIVSADLDEMSTVENHDEVGHSYRRESMRDEDCKTAIGAAGLCRQSVTLEECIPPENDRQHKVAFA